MPNPFFQPAYPVPLPLFLQAAFFIVLLSVASLVDIRKRVIPNSICALVALTGLIGFSPVKLFGILAALPLFIPTIFKEGSIGGGDIKLTAAAGFVLGFGRGIAGLTIGLAAMLLFFTWSIAVTPIREKKDKRCGNTALPMAPFLSIGFVAIYILRNFAGF